jgi:hypothetical protein
MRGVFGVFGGDPLTPSPPRHARIVSGIFLLLRLCRPALIQHGKTFRKIVLRRRPVERHAFARPFLQRRAVGRDRLLKARRPALPLTEREERVAEIVLRRRPVERRVFARPFLQRRAVGRDRLVKARRPALCVESEHSSRGSSAMRRSPTVRRGCDGRAECFGLRSIAERERMRQERSFVFPRARRLCCALVWVLQAIFTITCRATV